MTRLDFNGVKNTYSYEANSWRETARTEAAGTPQARTITTTWHPTLRLPATLTEPGRVTEFSYDPNGNLLSKKVTADGVSRTQSWSYLANGLLDTATDARGKVTRYTYDAQGNLATVTNPLNQITRYGPYDPHGNPLSMVEPNGVGTSFSYDLRQRLKTRTTDSETTSFDYLPTGLLSKVTLPDGSWLAYRYDPAHRLIGIDHSNGSRTDYTLDNAGNLKREDRNDPAGVLAAAQQRVQQAQTLPSAPQAQ
ncbi:RHS repeat protein [Chitiniphilus shinanonensis]|uniref:RHS repeat protein n=1 Tax=Chitiniphilus shinanonensis TaxID=553088 RepID=UPI00036D26D7|nr:RHS repeat protein [Chitiniphilus shinanonensis]